MSITAISNWSKVETHPLVIESDGMAHDLTGQAARVATTAMLGRIVLDNMVMVMMDGREARIR
jgi:hypothetical protein